jgi:hypothetical protein
VARAERVGPRLEDERDGMALLEAPQLREAGAHGRLQLRHLGLKVVRHAVNGFGPEAAGLEAR